MDHDEQLPVDIRFSAKIKADELRFDVAPENSVVFTGDAADDSTSGSKRTNLPDEVEENVTYRDVHIDYLIEAKLLPEAPG
ncbi:hypothetical protein [Actinomadura latina]|uniref:Uncharacterized protein n=1 Tax=Actinomadura latina TaxID=163603 RepID=A0A846YXP0_9ACTN|nr:hypothetical protein [Actinomadura latina]NKZ02883.1 hypothetical protein [Actinomadura latina]